jgi:hypothetical protein
MMRVGLYRSVHVKTLRSQKLRTLLTHVSFSSRRPLPLRMTCVPRNLGKQDYNVRRVELALSGCLRT